MAEGTICYTGDLTSKSETKLAQHHCTAYSIFCWVRVRVRVRVRVGVGVGCCSRVAVGIVLFSLVHSCDTKLFGRPQIHA